MPAYDYVCKHCGSQFEKWVRYADADLAQECPQCQSKETHRQISRVAISSGSSSGSPAPSGGCSTTGRFR